MKYIDRLLTLTLFAVALCATPASAADDWGDTLAYCSDTADSWYAAPGCGTATWGIRIPPALIPRHSQLHEVQFLSADSGTYQLRVHTGQWPTTPLFVEDYTFDTSAWQSIAIPYSLPVFDTAPLWITFSTTGLCSVAARSAYSGNPDGSWILDGDQWRPSHEVDGSYGSWMIRLRFAEAEKVHLILDVVGGHCGHATGAGYYYPGDTATIEAIPSERNCQFVSWGDGSTDNPYSFVIESDLVISAIFSEHNGIDDIDTDGLSYTLRGLDLTVDNPRRHTVALYDIAGRRLATTDDASLQLPLPAAGIYILQSPGFPAHRIVATR